MNNSMFGSPSLQGMFGQQQGGPLMQLLASNPQLMQMLLAGGGQAGMPLTPPMGGPMPEQYNATPGSVPGTVDQNVLLSIPPQNPGAPGAFGGIPPEIIRMLLGPRSI